MIWGDCGWDNWGDMTLLPMSLTSKQASPGQWKRPQVTSGNMQVSLASALVTSVNIPLAKTSFMAGPRDTVEGKLHSYMAKSWV